MESTLFTIVLIFAILTLIYMGGCLRALLPYFCKYSLKLN